MLRDALYSVHRRQRWKRVLIGVCAVVLGVFLMYRVYVFCLNKLKPYGIPRVLSRHIKPTPDEAWMKFRCVVHEGEWTYSEDIPFAKSFSRLSYNVFLRRFRNVEEVFPALGERSPRELLSVLKQSVDSNERVAADRTRIAGG